MLLPLCKSNQWPLSCLAVTAEVGKQLPRADSAEYYHSTRTKHHQLIGTIFAPFLHILANQDLEFGIIFNSGQHTEKHRKHLSNYDLRRL